MHHVGPHGTATLKPSGHTQHYNNVTPEEWVRPDTRQEDLPHSGQAWYGIPRSMTCQGSEGDRDTYVTDSQPSDSQLTTSERVLYHIPT